MVRFAVQYGACLLLAVLVSGCALNWRIDKIEMREVNLPDGKLTGSYLVSASSVHDQNLVLQTTNQLVTTTYTFVLGQPLQQNLESNIVRIASTAQITSEPEFSKISAPNGFGVIWIGLSPASGHFIYSPTVKSQSGVNLTANIVMRSTDGRIAKRQAYGSGFRIVDDDGWVGKEDTRTIAASEAIQTLTQNVLRELVSMEMELASGNTTAPAK